MPQQIETAAFHRESEDLPELEEVRVTLRYSGQDVDDGSLDVENVFAALNVLSSAFYRLADRESPDTKQCIRVTGVSKSSANVHLAIFQMAHAHPAIMTALTGGAAYLGKKLADIVIEKIATVARAKKHIQNALYTTEISVIGDRNHVIVINGISARLPVNKDIFDLLEEGTIDADLDKMTSPLREDAVDVFETKRSVDKVPDLHLEDFDRALSLAEAAARPRLRLNSP